MKHLTTYKIFESVRDISQYISDIFTDLTDEGYEVEVYDTDPNQKLKPTGRGVTSPTIYIPNHGNYTDATTIYITKLHEKDGTLYRDNFNTNDIRSYVDWLCKYMKSEGFTNYWAWVEVDKNIPVIPHKSDKFYNLVHYDNGVTWNEKKGKWVSHGLLRKTFNKIKDRIANEKILPKNILTENVKLVFAKDNK